MKWRGAEPARVHWNDVAEPRSVAFDDNYFSPDTGLQESQQIFVEGNQLPQRWAALDTATFTIAETGFGTGLNFLATWQAWQTHANPQARLHYLSIEQHPLEPGDLARALAGWTELSHLSEQLVANYPPLLPGRHRLLFDGGSVVLDLQIDELATALDKLSTTDDLGIDAWFLDGFTPSRNPGMWTAELFQRMSVLSNKGATFATFTAASDVRRGLESAGFQVERLRGHSGKREMLQGLLPTPAAQAAPRATPWHLPAHRFQQSYGYHHR